MSFSDRPVKIAVVFGTRPEFIKLFPIVEELSEHDKSIQILTINTGQQIDLVNQTMHEFAFKPDYDLQTMQDASSISTVIAKVIEQLEPILEKENPNFVVIQGDTTSAYASSLIAFLRRIKILHIEAGLRTYDNTSPFPEELFRRQISLMADFHFASTEKAKDNLLKEGIPSTRVMVAGNTVIDSLRNTLGSIKENYKKNTTKNILATFHRRENFEFAVDELCSALLEAVQRDKEIKIKFILHPNPNVKDKIITHLQNSENIQLIKPLPYTEFIQLLLETDVILTDSGGIQEESTFLDKKLLIIRDSTERMEALSSKRAKLVNPIKKEIVSSIFWSFDSQEVNLEETRLIFGDGYSAMRIVKKILEIIQ